MLLSWDSTYFALGDSCEIPPKYVVPSGRLSSPDEEANENGIIAVHEETRIWVFPNPAQGDLSIRSEGYGDFEIDILGIDGRQVLNIPIENGNGSVSLYGIGAGMYLLRIRMADGTVVRHEDKLIITD